MDGSAVCTVDQDSLAEKKAAERSKLSLQELLWVCGLNFDN